MGQARSGAIGISLMPSRRLSPRDIVALARRAEERGFDSVWIPETWGADAVSVLATLAGATSHIRLASGVFNVFSRSPALIAQTAATLQNLSGNRFILGLGTSGPRVVEDFHGVPYRRPLARTEDYVKIIRLALAGERIDYAGTEIRVEGFRLGNAPVQIPPIYIAALGPRNIRLTGRVADGWLPIFAVLGRMRPLIEDLRAAEEAAGRKLGTVTIGAYIPAVAGSRTEQLVAQQIAYYIGGMGTYYAEFFSRLGYQNEVDRIRELWRDGNVVAAARHVPEELIVRGSTASGQVAVEQFRREGVQLPILAPPRGVTIAELEATIDEFAPRSI